MKKLSIALLSYVLLLLIPSIAFASDVTDALNKGIISIGNNSSTTVSPVVVPVTGITTSTWTSLGYIRTANVTDVAIQSSAGADVLFMPGQGVDPWMIFVQSINGNSYLSDIIYTTNSTGGTIVYFPGAAGMTMAGAADLAIGDNFTIEIAGYFDMSKVNAHFGVSNVPATFHWYIVAADNVSFLGLVTGTATSGYHVMQVTSDGTTLRLKLDGTTIGMAAAVVCGTGGNAWTFADGDSTLYMDYLSITIGGILKAYIVWDNAATFTDKTGQGHDATPSFRTTCTSAYVSANLTSFGPISEAKAPASALAATVNLITSVPVITGNFTTTLTPTYPGKEVIEDITTAGNTPMQLLTMMLAAIVMLAISLSTTAGMRQFASSGHILIKWAVLSCLWFIGYAIGVFDFWMVVFWLMISPAIGRASTGR